MSEAVSMSMEQISIRLDPELSTRADALGIALATRAEFKALRMTRAAVLRMAMLEGLVVLEKRHLLPVRPKDRMYLLAGLLVSVADLANVAGVGEEAIQQGLVGVPEGSEVADVLRLLIHEKIRQAASPSVSQAKAKQKAKAKPKR